MLRHASRIPARNGASTTVTSPNTIMKAPKTANARPRRARSSRALFVGSPATVLEALPASASANAVDVGNRLAGLALSARRKARFA